MKLSDYKMIGFVVSTALVIYFINKHINKLKDRVNKLEESLESNIIQVNQIKNNELISKVNEINDRNIYHDKLITQLIEINNHVESDDDLEEFNVNDLDNIEIFSNDNMNFIEEPIQLDNSDNNPIEDKVIELNTTSNLGSENSIISVSINDTEEQIILDEDNKDQEIVYINNGKIISEDNIEALNDTKIESPVSYFDELSKCKKAKLQCLAEENNINLVNLNGKQKTKKDLIDELVNINNKTPENLNLN